MTTLFWIGQGFLAALFAITGGMKLAVPKEKLVVRLDKLAPLSPPALKALGLAEVLGAVGVLVPSLTGVVPGVVPWAALGLATVMMGAVVLYARTGEWGRVLVNVAILGVALFVAWGHWG